MNRSAVIILCSVVLVVSCQREVSFGTENFDYLPTTTGSSWRYNSTLRGDYWLDALSRDTVVNGNKYRIFNHTSLTGQGLVTYEYYGKSGKTYRRYFGPGDNHNPPGEIIILKDTVINTSWISLVPFQIYTDHHKYTVIARDIQDTVNGLPFDHVIQLDYDYSYDAGSATIPAGHGKTWFARGVGIIETYFYKSQGLGSFTDTVRIKSYSVK